MEVCRGSNTHLALPRFFFWNRDLWTSRTLGETIQWYSHNGMVVVSQIFLKEFSQLKQGTIFFRWVGEPTTNVGIKCGRHHWWLEGGIWLHDPQDELSEYLRRQCGFDSGDDVSRGHKPCTNWLKIGYPRCSMYGIYVPTCCLNVW